MEITSDCLPKVRDPLKSYVKSSVFIELSRTIKRQSPHLLEISPNCSDTLITFDLVIEVRMLIWSIHAIFDSQTD